jgi:hypothetical protein
MRERLCFAVACMLLVVAPGISRGATTGGWKVTDTFNDWRFGGTDDGNADYWWSPGSLRPIRSVPDDDFIGTLGSWWSTVYIPSDANYEVVSGDLKLKNTATCYWGANMDTATKAFQVVKGNFEVTADCWHTRSATNSNKFFGGIFVRQDSRNAVLFGLYQTGTDWRWKSAQIVNGTITYNTEDWRSEWDDNCILADVDTDGQMKIARNGNTLTLKLLYDDYWCPEHWREVGYTASYDHYEIGVFTFDQQPDALNSFVAANYFLCWNETEPTAATYTSTVFDFGTNPILDGKIYWGQDVPGASQIHVKTATSNTLATIWGSPTWSGDCTYDVNGATIASGKARYIRYQITLNRNNDDVPRVDWVRIVYPVCYTITGTAIDLGQAPILEGQISWTQTLNGGSIVVRTRTSDNGSSWDAYSSAYAAPEGSAITSTRRKWIQYQCVVNGTYTATPVINPAQVKIVYPMCFTVTGTAIDLGQAPILEGQISWPETLSGGSVVMRTSTSGDNTSWEPYSAAYATPGGSAITSTRQRYVRYQYVVNGTLTATPSVGSVKIVYPMCFTVTSTAIDLGAPPSADGTMSWSETLDGGTIVMRTRTSADGSSWGAYSSPYAPPAGSPIDHTVTSRYLQYQYVVTGTLTTTPSIGSIETRFTGVAPFAPRISSPTNVEGVWSNLVAPSLSWDAGAGNPGHILDWWYAMDTNVLSGATIIFASAYGPETVTATSFIDVTDGKHAFHLVARGDPWEYPVRADGESVFNIWKDTVAPGPTTINSPTHRNASENNNPNPVFTLSAADIASTTTLISGMAGWYYAFDNNPATIPSAGGKFTTSSQVAIANVELGGWWMHAQAADWAGNIGPVSHYKVVISNMEVLTKDKVRVIPSPVRGGRGVIQYDLAGPVASMKIEVMDEAGRKLEVYDAPCAQGINRVEWDTRNVANGVYIVRIRVKKQDGKELEFIKKTGVVR